MDIVPVFAGLDYHEDSIRVCVMDREGQVLLNRYFPNAVEQVAEAVWNVGWPRSFAIEACCGAADFAQELVRIYNFDVRLAHPGYVKRMKQGPDKTDAGDAFVLADLLRSGHLPEVWLAPEKIRQLRSLTRFRRQLVNDRKKAKLRVRALLREHRAGLPPANPWTKAWLEWVRTEAPLGEHGRWVMGRHLECIAYLSREIKAVEERLAEAVKDDPLTAKLREQPGVALITAATLRAEIGSFTRFGSGKQLARYCGLTPCNASSGKRQADAGLIRAGNADLRTILIECAHRIARYDDRWKAMKNRLVYQNKKPMSVAAAAIANRFTRWLYHEMVICQQPLEMAA
jgi:transposase